MGRLFLGIWICLFAFVSVANGANVIREAKKVIKKARFEENGGEAQKVKERLDAAEKNLMDALSEEKKQKKRAGIYYTAALVQCRLNDIENTKIYLKRGYDTTLYYNSIYKIYHYMEQCDSVETHVVQNLQNAGKYKYRSSAKKILLDYRQNLLNAGRYYMGKKNYSEAFRFLDLYLTSVDYPMFAKDFLSQTDSMYIRAAYWALAAAYYTGNHEGVIYYAPTALRYPKNRSYVQEYLCRSLKEQGRIEGWLHALKQGVICFPDHIYFFTTLTEYLDKCELYDDMLFYADKVLQYNPKSTLAWFTKALAYMRKEDYSHCIENCDVVLTMDSMHVEANYSKALAYCNLAKAGFNAMQKEKIKSKAYKLFRLAMLEDYSRAVQPLENMRRAAPDQQARWAPLLYQVYLNLNKGKEFAEIERIVKSLNASGNK